MSDEKPTPLDDVPPWGRAMINGLAKLTEKIVEQNGRVTKGEDRLNAIEAARTEDERRRVSHSIKVRSISESDVAQDAELANEKVAREALAARVGDIEAKVGDLHKLATGILTNPKVLAVGRALVLLLAGYAASKGVRLLP